MRLMNELTAVKTELRRIGVNYNQEIKNQNYILKRGGTIATGSSRLNPALLDRAIKQVDESMKKAGDALWRILA